MQPTRLNPAQYDENFPVASRLLLPEWRAPILSFYSFIRGMDEISDSPTLPHEQKRQQLRLIKIGLKKENPELLPDWAQEYYRHLEEKRLSARHGELLWKAFWQDTEKTRYHNFTEVLDYCKLSAAPVGRAVLEIAGEKHPNLLASDALCISLQLINHLQDLRSDYLERNRCYLPQSWLREAGIHESVLEKKRTGPKLKQVQHRWINETDKLLKAASRLPRSVKNRRLRWEIKIILAWAQELNRKLRRQDPLKGRVRLTKLEKVLAAIGGILFIY